MEQKLNFSKSITAGLLAGATSAVINCVLFGIFHSMDVLSDSILIKPGEPMMPMSVIMASIIPAIIASIVFFLLERYTKKGFKIFAILATILAVLSLSSPFKVIPGVTTNYALVLCLMHIVVAGAVLFFINRAKDKNATTGNSL